jgi:hypothetical protein
MNKLAVSTERKIEDWVGTGIEYLKVGNNRHVKKPVPLKITGSVFITSQNKTRASCWHDK